MVDSHAHLDSARYRNDLDATLERAWSEGVRAILSIGIGDGPATMHMALELARFYAGRSHLPAIFATAGVHPHEARLAGEDAYLKLDALLAEPEVVAAGEIGLDYYYDHSPREIQRAAFIRQMEIAAFRNRPVVIHCRASEGSVNAWDEALELIETHWAPTALGGILHCFNGEWRHARRALDCGFLISFAGNLTFPKSEGMRAIAARLPGDCLLIETDAPFLAPAPHRGQRNEPAWVGAVAAKLAELRGMQIERIAAETAANFSKLFATTWSCG